MSSESWTRTLAQLEANRRRWQLKHVGWYDARTRRSHDLLGFIDALAFPETGGTIAIQYTSATNMVARVHKLRNHPNLALAHSGGWKVLVWAFNGMTGTLKEKEI